jgi:hypothetical protein
VVLRVRTVVLLVAGERSLARAEDRSRAVDRGRETGIGVVAAEGGRHIHSLAGEGSAGPVGVVVGIEAVLGDSRSLAGEEEGGGPSVQEEEEALAGDSSHHHHHQGRNLGLEMPYLLLLVECVDAIEARAGFFVGRRYRLMGEEKTMRCWWAYRN